MKIRMLVFFAFLSVLFLAGCAVTDVDKSVDFSKLRTFSWGESEVQVDHPLFKGDLIEKRITRAVESEFSKLGVLRDDRNPDFEVSYKTYTEKKEKTRTSPYYGYPYYGYPFFSYRFGFFPFMYGLPPAGIPVKEKYTQGTLIIDIRDTRTDKVVWRGSVSGSVDESSKLEKLIRKGVKAIIRKYPVKEGIDGVKDASSIS